MTGTSSDLAEQLAYYRAIANEYHEHTIDVPGRAELLEAIDGFRPTGDVLELACGSGFWTDHLRQHARSVTAVDGAPEMLALARDRIGGDDDTVAFIEADLFTWRPTRRYDAVLFGFWISHLPDDRFDHFWSMVAEGLTPGGRVFFFDDTHRTDAELVDGADSPMVERRLNDGTAFRVIKIPHRPDDLERRLRAAGWEVTVESGPGPFYWAEATR